MDADSEYNVARLKQAGSLVEKAPTLGRTTKAWDLEQTITSVTWYMIVGGLILPFGPRVGNGNLKQATQ